MNRAVFLGMMFILAFLLWLFSMGQMMYHLKKEEYATCSMWNKIQLSLVIIINIIAFFN